MRFRCDCNQPKATPMIVTGTNIVRKLNLNQRRFGLVSGAFDFKPTDMVLNCQQLFSWLQSQSGNAIELNLFGVWD
jgi:hypothetical protein